MMPGMPERRGITSLFAAFNIADGAVISQLHRRHRAIEFKRFLTAIDKAVRAGLDIHLVADNYGTHKTPEIKAWLARHPRFHMHFTPTGSSWLHQVVRWFGLLTDKLIRHGAHRHPRLDRHLERRSPTLHLGQDRRRRPQLTDYLTKIKPNHERT
jgi:hypothetical protein